jgi:hypothetical protein
MDSWDALYLTIGVIMGVWGTVAAFWTTGNVSG